MLVLRTATQLRDGDVTVKIHEDLLFQAATLPAEGSPRTNLSPWHDRRRPKHVTNGRMVTTSL